MYSCQPSSVPHRQCGTTSINVSAHGQIYFYSQHSSTDLCVCITTHSSCRNGPGSVEGRVYFTIIVEGIPCRSTALIKIFITFQTYSQKSLEMSVLIFLWIFILINFQNSKTRKFALAKYLSLSRESFLNIEEVCSCEVAASFFVSGGSLLISKAWDVNAKTSFSDEKTIQRSEWKMKMKRPEKH